MTMPKRGRPTKEPSAKERQKVIDLVENNAPISDIAKILKRSIPNVRKYFSKEILSGKKILKEKAAPFKITDAHRERVIRYIGCKMSILDVARALGCTEEDLRAHFAEEIATGAAKFRAKVLDSLDDQMAEGTVGATNRLEALTGISPAEPGAPAAQAGYVGKKSAALAQAKAVVNGGSKFAPPSAPKLVVNNGSK